MDVIVPLLLLPLQWFQKEVLLDSTWTGRRNPSVITSVIVAGCRPGRSAPPAWVLSPRWGNGGGRSQRNRVWAPADLACWLAPRRSRRHSTTPDQSLPLWKLDHERTSWPENFFFCWNPSGFLYSTSYSTILSLCCLEPHAPYRSGRVLWGSNTL